MRNEVVPESDRARLLDEPLSRGSQPDLRRSQRSDQTVFWVAACDKALANRAYARLDDEPQ